MSFDRDEVVARVDLPALADRLLGPRHPRSRMWRCPDPGHLQTGRTPPVHVFRDSKGLERWYCFPCGKGGTAIDLVLAAGLARDFKEALAWLADIANIAPTPERRTRRVPRSTPVSVRPAPPSKPSDAMLDVLGQHVAACHRYLHGPDGQDVLAWLTDTRRLPVSVIDHVGVGADPGPSSLPRPIGVPRASPAAVFPVRRGDEVVFVQSRPIAPQGDQPRWLNSASTVTPNPRLAFYDPPDCDGRGPVVVTEGVIDTLSAVSAGYTAAALLGSGAANEYAITQLEERHRPVILALDNDPAGRRTTTHLRTALKSRGIVVSTLGIPEKFGDLNDWHVACGHDWPETLRSAIRLTAAAGPLGKRHEAPGVA